MPEESGPERSDGHLPFPYFRNREVQLRRRASVSIAHIRDIPSGRRGIRAYRSAKVLGYVPVMVRWLQEQGLEALSFDTKFGEDEDGQ